MAPNNANFVNLGVREPFEGKTKKTNKSSSFMGKYLRCEKLKLFSQFSQSVFPCEFHELIYFFLRQLEQVILCVCSAEFSNFSHNNFYVLERISKN